MKALSNIIFASVILSLLAVAIPAFAADASAAFLVGPAKQEATIAPGASATLSFVIANRLGRDTKFSLSPMALRADADGNLVPDPSASLVGITVAMPKTVEVIEGAQLQVNATVRAARNAEPRSVAIGMIATPIAAANGEVALHSRAAVIAIVRIAGDAKEEGSLSDFALVSKNDVQVQFSMKFTNAGSVHLNPYGVLAVKNMFGREVSAQKIDPWYVMPNTSRSRTVAIDASGFFGRYTATLSLNRGYGDMVDVKEVSFFVVPAWAVLAGSLIVLVIGAAVAARIFRKRAGSATAAIILLAAIAVASATHAQMSSSNYKLQSDSVNFGGGLSNSANYTQESTFGEIATGDASSTFYVLHAGYQQMHEVYLAVSDAADVTLSPALGSINGGTANGSTAITVTTDSASGYELFVNASTTPALSSGTDSFADYAPAGDPDFSFAVGSSQSAFGFSPEGADVIGRFLDNGTACNVGTSNAASACWDGFSTALAPVASSTSANNPSGTATTLRLRAAAGASRNQSAGSYQADVTFTALAL